MEEIHLAAPQDTTKTEKTVHLVRQALSQIRELPAAHLVRQMQLVTMEIFCAIKDSIKMGMPVFLVFTPVKPVQHNIHVHLVKQACNYMILIRFLFAPTVIQVNILKRETRFAENVQSDLTLTEPAPQVV